MAGPDRIIISILPALDV